MNANQIKISLSTVLLSGGLIFLINVNASELPPDYLKRPPSLTTNNNEKSNDTPLWKRWVSSKESHYTSRKSKKPKLAYIRKHNADTPPPTFAKRSRPIIDVHEHVASNEDAMRLLKSMDKLGIKTAALMGTPIYTITLNKKYGFERFEENNDLIIKLAKNHPTRFVAFPTIFPGKEGNFELLKTYKRMGARGFKLYLGHGASTGKEPFHVFALDDERMWPIYQWAEKEQVPIMLHTNLEKYHDEFVRMMNRYPKLRVTIPHFGLHKNSKRKLARLSALFDKHPNLYIDISFGYYTFHIQGFESLASWPSRFNTFFAKHSDRILFASDMVVTHLNDESFIDQTLSSYMMLLEQKEFKFFLRPKYKMRGLSLPAGILDQVYYKNAERFLGQ